MVYFECNEHHRKKTLPHEVSPHCRARSLQTFVRGIELSYCMPTKLCPRCKEAKPLAAFGKHRAKKDGLRCYCKSCKSDCAKIYYESHAEKCRERARTYYRLNAKKCLEQGREYRRLHPAKRRLTDSDSKARSRLLYPERFAARMWVTTQLAAGRLIPKPCFCGSTTNIQAHHPDYSKPKEIVWLCRNCHYAEHKRLKAI